MERGCNSVAKNTVLGSDRPDLGLKKLPDCYEPQEYVCVCVRVSVCFKL